MGYVAIVLFILFAGGLIAACIIKKKKVRNIVAICALACFLLGIGAIVLDNVIVQNQRKSYADSMLFGNKDN